MDYFITLIEALKWPIVVVVIVVILREGLTSAIPGLRRIKYGSFEAEFGGKLREVERKIGKADLPATVTVKKPGSQAAVTKDEGENIRRLADISPRAAIAEVWRLAEVALREAVNTEGRNETSVFNIINRLHNKGVLSMEARNALMELRDLRNRAMHHAEVELRADQAIAYEQVVRSIINTLNKSEDTSNSPA